MQKICLATGNPGKAAEIREFFRTLDTVKFCSLADFPPVSEPDETGTSFVENALQKVEFYAKKLNFPSLAEDSGLVLDAFPEKFGLRTRREISASTDEEWIEKFLEILDGEKNRRATFFSAMAFFDPKTKKKFVATGECAGEITQKVSAPLADGVPVSSVFVPDGENVVFSALPNSKKNQISHRGKAAEKMAEFFCSFS